jgi:hypothetical protein
MFSPRCCCSDLSNGKELLGMRSDADNVQITAHQVGRYL